MLGSVWTRLGAILVAAAATTSSFGQSLKDYLHLRRHYGISRAAGEPALETLVGTRVIEIAATVKGVVTVAGGNTAILIERSSGQPQTIKADVHPDWLEGNEVLTRLIIRAYRRDADSPLEARMIAVAPDAPITQLEDQERAADEARARKVLASRKATKRHASHQTWTLPASEVTPTYAAFIKKQNPRLTGLQAVQIARAIIGFSLEYGVDARLIMAMVMVESGFDPTSTSHSGAMGLGQLMPGTAKWMGVSDAYDSTQNLYGTVKLVRTHLDQYRRQTGGEDFESLVLTLAAYNAGEGAVKRHGGVPPYRETQAYVRKVMKLYYRFCGR